MSKTKKPIDIIIRFPDKKIADEFCRQMSDGFGENHCNFSFHRLKQGKTGTKVGDYEKVFEQGKRVYFVTKLYNFS